MVSLPAIADTAMTIGFNVGYMIDAIAGLGQRATLSYSDDKSPVLIEAADPTDGIIRASVLMPMRV